MKEELTPEKMKEHEEFFRNTFPLQDIKVGVVVTEDMYRALRYYLGNIIDKLPKPRIVSIHFDKRGQPHTLDDDIVETGKKMDEA